VILYRLFGRFTRPSGSSLTTWSPAGARSCAGAVPRCGAWPSEVVQRPQRDRVRRPVPGVERVEALDAAGRMRPGGRAQVAAAKADGRWAAAYASQRTAAVPDDLTAALAADDRARAAFEALGRSERYAVFLPLLKARTPEARAGPSGAGLLGTASAICPRQQRTRAFGDSSPQSRPSRGGVHRTRSRRLATDTTDSSLRSSQGARREIDSIEWCGADHIGYGQQKHAVAPAGGADDGVSWAWKVVDSGRSCGRGGDLFGGRPGAGGCGCSGQDRAGSRWGEPGEPTGAGDDPGREARDG
jgi:hypothetical protein